MSEGVIHPVIDAALIWAKSVDFNDASVAIRRFRLRHEALRRLFHRYVTLSAFHTVIAGASAVCGLAHAPGDVERASFKHARVWLTFLPGCTSSRAALEALQRETTEVQRAALTFVDRSVPATSAFLHFLNPSCAPMWLAKAAHSLHLRPGPQHSQDDAMAMYCDYWAALLAAADAGAALPLRLRNTLNAPLDASLDRDRLRVSPVLGLESLLYLYASPALFSGPSRCRGKGSDQV